MAAQISRIRWATFIGYRRLYDAFIFQKDAHVSSRRMVYFSEIGRADFLGKSEFDSQTTSRRKINFCDRGRLLLLLQLSCFACLCKFFI